MTSLTSAASDSVLSSASSHLVRGGGVPRSARRSLKCLVGAAALSLSRLESFLQDEWDADLSSGHGRACDREDDSINDEVRRLLESEEGMRNELEGLWLGGLVGWRDDDGDRAPEDDGRGFDDDDDDDDGSLRLDSDHLSPPSPIGTEGSLSTITIHGMEIFADCSSPLIPVLPDVSEEESLTEAKDEIIGREVQFEQTPDFKATVLPRHSEAGAVGLPGLLEMAERAARVLYGEKDDGMTAGRGGGRMEPLHAAAGIAALVWIAKRMLAA